MMLIATFMLGAFIIHSVFSEDIDDDDDKGGGMLIPAQIPIQQQTKKTLLYILSRVFFYDMPKNQLNKDELKCHILKLKHEIDEEPKTVWKGEKDLAHKYLNKVLNRIDEYRL